MGTKFDYLLILLSCIASIGAGIAYPLMNVVFGKRFFRAFDCKQILTVTIQATWLEILRITSYRTLPSPSSSFNMKSIRIRTPTTYVHLQNEQ